MNLARFLNPFRSTSFAWLFPFTWEVIKWFASGVPVTVEVFFHHRFGARCSLALLKGLFVLLFMGTSLIGAYGPPVVQLFPGFIAAYIFAGIGQWLSGQRRREADQIHSYSSGEPWPLWSALPISTPTVERYFEPLICFILARFIGIFDYALAEWLTLVALALFIKGQFRRVQLQTRRLDMIDGRFDANEAIGPRHRQPNENFVEARQAPHRGRRRHP